MLLEIASNRINRDEIAEAQELIDQFNKMTKVSTMTILAESLQAEIYLKTNKHEESTAIFSKLWAGLVKKEHMLRPEMIITKLNELEDHLGTDSFLEIFKANAPETPPPSELLKQQ